MPIIPTRDFREHYKARVEFKLSAFMREEPTEDDFVHEITGRLVACCDDDEQGETAGFFHASLIQFNEAIMAGIDSDRIGDGISGEIAEYWEVLFDVNTGRFKPDIRVDHETIGCNLLVIDFIEVFPKFRGHGLGSTTAKRIADVFSGGCALVAGIPNPLQFTPAYSDDPEKLEKLQAPKSTKEEALSKLQEYWSRAGFSRYGQTGIFLKGITCTADIAEGFV